MTFAISREYLFLSNYAYDNVFGWDREEVKENLNQYLSKFPEWLYENCMVRNPFRF